VTLDTTNAAQTFLNVMGWQPMLTAGNAMVIGGAVFTARHGFPWVYWNMDAQSGSWLVEDEKMRDHITQGFSGQFDGSGNLYLTDINRGRVLVCLDPLGQ
jgi:hypothetical protein